MTRWQQRAGLYTPVAFDFNVGVRPAQVPRRIGVHRQGNPGAEGKNGITWGRDTQSFDIHAYVDDSVCFNGIPPTQHAFHMNVDSAAVAQVLGFRTSGDYGSRGDYDCLGIETEDESPQSGSLAPGQTYGLSQDTRITLVLKISEWCRDFNLDPCGKNYKGGWLIDEHGTYDPKNRSEDLGNALNMNDLRLDVRDWLAGTEPWRTVGEFATGAPAPDSWKPGAVLPRPPVDTRIIEARDKLNAVINGGTP